MILRANLPILSPLIKRGGEISVPLCQHVTLNKGHLNIICMGSPLNKAFYGWLLATLKSRMYQYFGNALTWHTGPHNKSWRGIKESIWSVSLSPLCDKVRYHLLWTNTIYLILQYKMTPTHTQINYCQSSGRSSLLLPFPNISSGRGHHWDDREVLFTAFCWSRLPLIKTCRSLPFHGPQKICKTFDSNKACTRLMMMFWSMRTQ